MGIAGSILDGVARLGAVGLHAAVAGLAFGETAVFLDFIVPGEVGMVVAGAAAERTGVPLVTMILAATVGATIGDSVSYGIGRRWGRPLLCRYEVVRTRMAPKIERAEGWFDERGGAAIFFGRFVGALRAVVPLAAGIGRMPYGRFLPWNIAASLLWGGITVTLGYVAGEHIASFVDRTGWAISGVVVVGALVWYLVSRARKV